MFGMHYSIRNEFDRVRRSAVSAADYVLAKTSFAIRQDAAGSIQTSEEPSPPGQPPHTRRGRLRSAILYAVEGHSSAVIGTMFSVVGDVGEGMEFGGIFRDRQYDARPFMGPAFEKNVSQFASNWNGTIGT